MRLTPNPKWNARAAILIVGAMFAAIRFAYGRP